MSWKRVSFSEMGSSCPSQNIHPAGAKLPANILISPTYGCAITFGSVLRRENPLQRDAKIEHQIRHHVVMRLAAAGGRDTRRVHSGQVCHSAETVRDRFGKDHGGVRIWTRADSVGDVEGMVVVGQFAERDGVRRLAPFFAVAEAASEMNRHVAAQVRQRESRLAVAAKGRSEKREERLVLVDGQELPVALRPAFRGEVETHDADFGEKWFGHEA